MDTTNPPDEPGDPAGGAPAPLAAGPPDPGAPSTPVPASPPVTPPDGFGRWQTGGPSPDSSHRSLLVGVAAGAGGVIVLAALLYALWPDGGSGPTTPAAATSPAPTAEAPPTATAATPSVTVADRSVPATQVWTPMGVTCATGDVLDIAMSGSASHDQTPEGVVGPTGLLDPRYHQYNVEGFPDANTMTIIGSLDEDPSTFFVVGEGTTYVCPRDGELHLGVNDAGVQNNSGAFAATITRTTHG